MISLEAMLLIAGLGILTVATMLPALRGRPRRKHLEPLLERPSNVDLEHGAALLENIERMRKDAPFRRQVDAIGSGSIKAVPSKRLPAPRDPLCSASEPQGAPTKAQC